MSYETTSLWLAIDAATDRVIARHSGSRSGLLDKLSKAEPGTYYVMRAEAITSFAVSTHINNKVSEVRS